MRIRSAIASFLVLSALAARGTELDVPRVYQETPLWCWTAVGEMVFSYYGVANINPAGDFQCGIISLLNPVCNQDCRQCVVPAGSLTTMNNMLTRYPNVASNVTRTSTAIRTRTLTKKLSLQKLQAEIDAGRPVVAGISPSGYRAGGVSQHVVLIVGYDDDDLLVNDPFPYGTTAFLGDPYEAAGGELVDAGQYRISYTRFATRLRWNDTIYAIRCSGADCLNTDDEETDDTEGTQTPATRYGWSCTTAVTRCGLYQPLPVGAACWCPTPYGPSGGTVVP